MLEILPMGILKLSLKIDSMQVLLYHAYFKNEVYVKLDQSIKLAWSNGQCDGITIRW